MLDWLLASEVVSPQKLRRPCQAKQLLPLKDLGWPTRDQIAKPSRRSAILFYNLPSSSDRDWYVKEDGGWALFLVRRLKLSIQTRSRSFNIISFLCTYRCLQTWIELVFEAFDLMACDKLGKLSEWNKSEIFALTKSQRPKR